ncbi:hypothetical protein XELAEV_18008793mg [Xenopus laevis]|uniref:Uncharacterized protein n=1 Tax=Xenopus laevis TaxID=8355 RepID=A0A974HZT8_XENLA|nr:hypothetical protein XELAEV_18008793mg [Xenopus laevis]
MWLCSHCPLSVANPILCQEAAISRSLYNVHSLQKKGFILPLKSRQERRQRGALLLYTFMSCANRYNKELL